ncbi:MAG: sigma-70 family RNA polymerase sigma factor [Planctomycetota bacterium]|jgi:DNA-directed RNA polymerase specialized sigma24 family protein
MNSEAKRDFDDWFSKNYDELNMVARRLHRDHSDLLHHTYISCIKALENNTKILKNLPGYVHTSMFNLSLGSFRKLYQIRDTPEFVHISNYDLAEAIRREEAMILANHLSWFDRTVLMLYLEGWSMAELARESGIKVSVFYMSISESKKKLRHVIRQRTD